MADSVLTLHDVLRFSRKHYIDINNLYRQSGNRIGAINLFLQSIDKHRISDVEVGIILLLWNILRDPSPVIDEQCITDTSVKFVVPQD
jgi:hypothetical protein